MRARDGGVELLFKEIVSFFYKEKNPFGSLPPVFYHFVE